MELDIVNYGIASRFGNTIVMNYDLARYEDYCKEVFEHELRHNTKLTKEDMAMDTFEGSILTNLAFCFRHPRGFSQFVPFGKYKGKPFIDLNLIGVYVIAITLVSIYLIIF